MKPNENEPKVGDPEGQNDASESYNEPDLDLTISASDASKLEEGRVDGNGPPKPDHDDPNEIAMQDLMID